ncbi:MAG: hypothetical protein M3Q36_00560 [bacterium]|nr:hypothetical protein [bacterium]
MTPEQLAIEQKIHEGLAQILGDELAVSPPLADPATSRLVSYVIAHLEDFGILAEAKGESVPSDEVVTLDPISITDQS